LVYLILLLGVGLVTGRNLPRYIRIANNGIAAQAAVASTNCSNHGEFSYRFSIGPETYTGIGTASSIGVACQNLRAGDQVVVYYLPADPHLNQPDHPARGLTNELTAVLLAAVVIPAIFVLGLRSVGVLSNVLAVFR